LLGNNEASVSQQKWNPTITAWFIRSVFAGKAKRKTGGGHADLAFSSGCADPGDHLASAALALRGTAWRL
jgi:hypothetical protein